MFLPHIAKRATAAAAAAVESSAVVPAAAAVPIVQPLPLPAVASTAAAAAVITAEPIPAVPAAADSAEDSAPQRPAVIVCADCGRRHRAEIPETVPAFPIQLKICGCDGRGASLQFSPTGSVPWYTVSYHATAVAAAAAFLDLPHFKDTEPDHYRIKCSAGEIEPEPEPAAESAAEPVPPSADFLVPAAAAAAVEPEPEPEPLPLQERKPAAAAAGETRSRFCAFMKLNREPTDRLFDPTYSMNVVAMSRGSVVELEVIACVDNPEMVGQRITQDDPRLKPWQWRAIIFDLLELEL